MDQSTLVGNRISDGRRFVERFVVDGNPLLGAFWTTEDEGAWYLFLVTDTVERAASTDIYRAVHASLDKLGDEGLAGSDIKVLAPNDPVAKDVLALAARFPKSLARWLGGRLLGGAWFDEIYIYPPRAFTFTQPNPMTTEDISRELLRLMNRAPGGLQPSSVALKDGTSFSGVPFGLELGPRNTMIARFVVDGEAAPRVVLLDDIAAVS